MPHEYLARYYYPLLTHRIETLKHRRISQNSYNNQHLDKVKDTYPQIYIPLPCFRYLSKEDNDFVNTG